MPPRLVHLGSAVLHGTLNPLPSSSATSQVLTRGIRLLNTAAGSNVNSSTYTPAYLPNGATTPTSSSSLRRTEVRNKLAAIEATKGVVSAALTDSFGREHDYLRISLTEKCNLRCTYCMPDEGAQLSPKENLLSTDEVVRLASIFVDNGVRKIRLTGGEPTIRKDLVEIVGRLSALGLQSLGMTSNGIALSRKLPALIQAGLTHLNISLDTLDEHKFELMTRRRGHSTVLNTIQQAASFLPSSEDFTDPNQSHLKSLKLNVVVINNLNSEEIFDFIELTRSTDISIRFIEYMPFDGNKWSTKKLLPSSALLASILRRYNSDFDDTISNVIPLKPAISDTARTYRIKGYKGSFGFISSMTDNFCSGCSRLRLSAEGSMKVCLFGESTLSLRDMLRTGASDQEIISKVGLKVKQKHYKHDGKSEICGNMKRHSVGSELSLRSLRDAVHPSQTHIHYNGAHRQVPSYLLQPQRQAATLRHIHTRRGQVSNSAAIGESHLGLPISRLLFSVRRRTFTTSLKANSQRRGSSDLTHIDKETGEPTMVSITDKLSSSRSATATGRIIIPQVAYEILNDEIAGKYLNKKGQVLSVARLAGIMGAKRTSDLIPLCHPLNLTNVQIALTLIADEERRYVQIAVTTECQGSTGVEMEALTAVSVACLTVWDMLKAIAGKEMTIEDIKVIKKTGGKSGDWIRPEA